MIARLLLFFGMSVVAACGEQSAPADSAPSETVTAPATAPYENLTPREFAERMGGEDVVLLDVRTPGEIAGGKIDGAIELDFRDPDFATKVAALDREPTYLVYCASGGRSSQTCEMMSDAGFDKLYNLTGGYTAWREQ